ncbi:MCE-family protein MCE3A [Mycobacterium vulneris]|uniref:MCE family protein n=1 Tax=Mycolicibacterium septicum DSM 44393 TaxID=1341646 RepID=A0A7X6MV88_9MYCO|nr:MULTISPECIES: MCE family protein [Mycolicibacterium]MCP3811404.1 MCE family protein [Mycobacteriaceae bacterium Msp059]OCB47892.1 MCE-family protein MCE3A [Mycolicibacterium vulneris]NKZ14914.1 MCE family protein [Mycolicibacterium septicum DSM 44393]OBK07189.1 MCE-family protein MCE3A [Mycolicibacterium fortuitum]OBK65710.1 MCE-family protein MCE3A [Mycolicibacterium fortuitum]
MSSNVRSFRSRRLWWALALVVAAVVFVYATLGAFTKTFTSYARVTLTSDRSGLVMEPGARVKLRGVQVGEVAAVSNGKGSVSLTLNMYPNQLKYIPANVQARIRATTVFGAKYVDLVYPADASSQRLAAGAVLKSDNVAIEVNTVFENLVGLLDQVDPAKLNGILSALSEGVRGRGERIGEATTALNEVLQQLNPRAETIRNDFRSLRGFADTYSEAAQNILKTLDAASTTSTTLSNQAQQLDALLLSVAGFSNSGVQLLGPNKDNLIQAVNDLAPTTALLAKYSPTYTCLLVGAKTLLDGYDYTGITGGRNGKSLIVDAALLFGDDQYRYPDNLPITGAKGGPGGKPSCGSLPDAATNFPVRGLVTDTGWGTGLDYRPNPGIGRPFYMDLLPTTRGYPQPPVLRGQDRGAAPGPIPYPGAPPYGAPMYAPDGSPLYPGLPPAPAPMSPPEPGPPPPGREPFVVPDPADMQPFPPTTLPPVPAAPSP